MKDTEDTRWESRWKRNALLVIALGAFLRAGYAFPVHQFPADADCLMAGLRSFRILQGQFPVFLMPPRLGSLECYGHALAFRLFGISRASLSITTLVSGSLLLVVFAALCKRILGPKLGLIALLLLSLPPAAYLFWTYMPNSYAETVLLCGAFLALAVKMDESGESALGLTALGLVGGLAWWQSLLTLGGVLPVAVWYFLRSRQNRTRRFLLFGFAFLGGALPWLVFNLHHRFASFRDSYAAAPVSSLEQSVSNAAYLATGAIPELLVSVYPEPADAPFRAAHRTFQILTLALSVVSVLLAFFAATRKSPDRAPGPPRERDYLRLLLAIGAFVCLLPMISNAGALRGGISRYVILLMLVMPILLAWFLALVSRRSTLVAALLLLCVLFSNIWIYPLPGTRMREAASRDAAATDQLVKFLRSRKIDAVCGDYWLVYGINFLSRESIVAAPLNQNLDYLRYGPNLPQRPLRWALVSRTARDLRAWARRASLPGTIELGAQDYFVFLPDPNPPSEEIGPRFLGRLRETYYLK